MWNQSPNEPGGHCSSGSHHCNIGGYQQVQGVPAEGEVVLTSLLLVVLSSDV